MLRPNYILYGYTDPLGSQPNVSGRATQTRKTKRRLVILRHPLFMHSEQQNASSKVSSLAEDRETYGTDSS